VLTVPAGTSDAQGLLDGLARSLCTSCLSLVQVGMTRYEAGDLAGATSSLQVAVEHHPANATLHFVVGNALYRGGRLPEAAAAYEQSLAYQPLQIEALLSAGFTRYDLGQPEAAIRFWEQAVHLDPREPLARAALAVGYAATGRQAEAVGEYGLAISLDSRYRHPEQLAIDVRWKPAAREALQNLLRLMP
jgi:tetratricopeptide (TPR) repeat protein